MSFSVLSASSTSPATPRILTYASHSHIAERPLPEDDPRRRKPDIARAVELLGWQPRTSLEEGLAKTIAWFEDQAMVEPLIATAAE